MLFRKRKRATVTLVFDNENWTAVWRQYLPDLATLIKRHRNMDFVVEIHVS